MNLFSEDNNWVGYGPITPLIRQYGEPSSSTPAPSFFQELLAALYGEPGAAKPKFSAFNSSDPAMLARLGLAVLGGFPKGVVDFVGVLKERLKLYLAASQGYVAAMIEKPERPGTVSESNPLILHLAERGELKGLLKLGQQLQALDKTDIWTAFNTLKQHILQAVIDSVAGYREKLLNAKSVDEFGDLLGRMWGYVSADTICNTLALRTLDKAARKLGRINVSLAEKKLLQIDQTIEEGYRRSAIYVRVERRFEELARTLLDEATIAEIVEDSVRPVPARNPPAIIEAKPAQKALPTSKISSALTSGQMQARPEMPSGKPPQQPAQGMRRHFLLGDLEPAPGIPLLPPSGIVRTEMIATRWSAAEITGIRSNIVQRPRLPTWVQSLRDEQIFEIASFIESNHPRGKKLNTKQLDLLVAKTAGMIQEIVNPMRPEFPEHYNLLKTLLGEEGRWNLDTLQYAPRLYTLEPDASSQLPIARRSQATDGVWFVQAKDEPIFLFPMVYESKSLSNTNDLFYERGVAKIAGTGKAYSVRDPRRAQLFRDVERLSNIDVILEIPMSGGTSIRRIHIPAGMIGISRKTTRFVLVTPRKAEGLHAMNELIGVRFSRNNIIVLPPAYDRREIEMFGRRLLEAPYDKLIPAKKQP